MEMRPNEDNPLRFHEQIEMTSNEDYMLLPYEAALKGSVDTLTALIRNDPLILHKVSLTSFNETPLHISALAGNLDFTEALLSGKTELATRLDSRNRSPLHLASAEGHTEIVKALLRVNVDACMVHDDEGRIPLHLAVMRGQVELIEELIHAQPNSVLEKLNGNTVLHIAVKYNQLKSLRRLVTLQLNEDELFDLTDHLGNTILHSAVMLKQSETIRYLVSVPKMKAKINTLNRMGFSALDLLEHCPRDFKSLEIGDILIKAGSIRRSTEDPNPSNTVPSQSQLVPVAIGGEVKAMKSMSFTLRLKGKIKSVYRKCKNYLTHQGNWVEEMQGTLMLVATLTATISFQVAISPPGGVWQQNYTNITVGGFNYGKCVAGSAVLAYVYPQDYLLLIIFAIISFIASLGVVLLVISGLPLQNKFCTWLMIIAMILAITGMLLTFIEAMFIITPDHILYTTAKALDITQYVWIGLVGIVAVFTRIRLLFWVVTVQGKSIRFARRVLSCPMKNQDPIC